MALQSKEDYRAETMKNIRENAIGKMNEVINNCYKIMNTLSISKRDIPNIIVAYNNRILLVEKEFKKAGIEFYDRETCETRFIIENYMQGLILLGKNALSRYIYDISHIPKKNKKDFIKVSKKAKKSHNFLKRFMKNRKHPLLSNEQLDDANNALDEYLDYYNKVADFTISNDIIQAILFYKILANTRSITDFDNRIDKVDSELYQLGYESIKDTLFKQIDSQDLSFANIAKLKPVIINKRF